MGKNFTELKQAGMTLALNLDKEQKLNHQEEMCSFILGPV